MITPTLEKLILSGNATYNTFVVGGTEKHILNVKPNRFIIITKLIYYNSVNTDHVISDTQWNTFSTRKSNTQLKVLSEKSCNHFVFRNNYNLIPRNTTSPTYIIIPLGNVSVDTYLIHESDVSFSFCVGGRIEEINTLETPAKSIAYPPPADYGKFGQNNAILVRRLTNANPYLAQPFYNAPVGQIGSEKQQGEIIPAPVWEPGGSNTLQLEYPYDNSTRPETENAWSTPIVQVEYVEINGNPTNVSATL